MLPFLASAAMPARKASWDGWIHFTETGRYTEAKAPTKIITCKYCKDELAWNSTRCRHHLLSCKHTPDDVKDLYKRPIVEELPPEPSSSRGHGLRQQLLPFKRVPKTTAARVEEAWTAALATGNIPLNFCNNQELHSFFEALGVNFRPPHRDVVTRRILPQMHHSAEQYQLQLLDAAPAITVVIDTSTNARSRGIVAIIFATPFPVLIDIIECSGESKTSEFYVDKVMRAIVKLEESFAGHSLRGDSDRSLDLRSKICAVTTDNENLMIRFRKLLAQELPQIISVGCTAHLLNLIIKDYCKIQHVNDLLKILQNMTSNVKHSSNKKGHYDTYWERYIEEEKAKGNTVHARGLKVPVDTRWYSYTQLVRHSLDSKTVLKRLHADDIICYPRFSDPSFWHELQQVLSSRGRHLLM